MKTKLRVMNAILILVVIILSITCFTIGFIEGAELAIREHQQIGLADPIEYLTKSQLIGETYASH